jgi:outer membrane protein TolC
MKTNILLFSCALWAAAPLCGQTSLDDVLESVAQHNLSLQALHETMAAQQLDNDLSRRLPDPEVEVNYLWGSPQGTGERTDVTATQQLDYATLGGQRRRVVQQQNALLDKTYLVARQRLLAEARQVCIDLIYYNALLRALAERLAAADALAAAQERLLATGAGNAVDRNNVVMAAADVRAEYRRVESERATRQQQLERLNGDVPIALTDTVYPVAVLPADYASWAADAAAASPALAAAQQEVALSQSQLSLSKAQRVPALTVGYMSEHTIEQSFRGLTVGVAVPLWAGRQRVRSARSALTAAQLRADEERRALESRRRQRYDKAVALQTVAETYRTSLSAAGNSRLLRKSYDEGQISLLEYLLQMDYCYTAVGKALAAERDFQQAYGELMSGE